MHPAKPWRGVDRAIMTRPRGRGGGWEGVLLAASVWVLAAAQVAAARTAAGLATAGAKVDTHDSTAGQHQVAAAEAVTPSLSLLARDLQRRHSIRRSPDRDVVVVAAPTPVNDSWAPSLGAWPPGEGSRRSGTQRARLSANGRVLVRKGFREKLRGGSKEEERARRGQKWVEGSKARGVEASGVVDSGRKKHASREPVEERAASDVARSKAEVLDPVDTVADLELDLSSQRVPLVGIHGESPVRLRYRQIAASKRVYGNIKGSAGAVKALGAAGNGESIVGDVPIAGEQTFAERVGGHAHARRRLSGADETEAQDDDEEIVGEFGSVGFIACLVCFGLLFCVLEVTKCYCCIEWRRRQQIRRRREEREGDETGQRIPIALSRPLRSSLPEPQEKDGLVEIVIDGLPIITQLGQDGVDGDVPSARGYAVADASRALQQAMEQARRVLPRGSSLRLINHAPLETPEPDSSSSSPPSEPTSDEASTNLTTASA